MAPAAIIRVFQHPTIIIMAFSIFLGLLGTREMVDGIGLWIVGFVDTLPNDAWYRPFHPPPPSYGYGFRPLSIIMVKAYIALFGLQTPPPLWFLFLKISLSGFAFGVGCWMWLDTLGRKKIALVAAIFGMFLAPHLFALWYLTEFDGLGAASSLVVSALLLKQNRNRLQTLSLGGLIIFTIFLKESSAILLFGIFVVHAVYFALRQEKKALVTTVCILISAAALWLIMAWKVVTGHVEGHFSGLSTELRWMIVGYTSTQMTIFISFMGTLLIALLSVDGILRKSRIWRWIIMGVVLSSFFWPPVATLNHYETYYFDQRYWMLGGGVVLNLALFAFIAQARQNPTRALAALLLLSMEATMGSALLLSSNPREDIASRLFLVGFPPLVLLFSDAVQQLSKHYSGEKSRFIFAAAPVMAIWFVFSHSVNALISHHARNEVDVMGHKKLGTDLKANDIVIFDNFIYWLSRDAIAGLSSNSAMVEDSQLIYVPSQLRRAELPRVNWGEDIKLEETYNRGTKMWWYSLQIRAKMDAGSRSFLKGDFKTLSHPFGLFKAFGTEAEPSALPATNYIEDSREITYGEHPTPLRNLIDSRGSPKWGVNSDFYQLSPQLNEWPRRLLNGVPLIERYGYQVELWTLNAD